MAVSTDKLTSLLEDQRQALLSGDFETLNRIAPALEATISKVATTGLTPQNAGALRRSAQRNAQLLIAARDGIAQARQFIKGPPQEHALSVYTAQGDRTATADGRAKDLRRL